MADDKSRGNRLVAFLFEKNRDSDELIAKAFACILASKTNSCNSGQLFVPEPPAFKTIELQECGR